MIIEGQKVAVRLSNRNREYFESKGFIFKSNKIIEVDIDDLGQYSESLVLLKCDKCNCKFKRKYRYISNRKKEDVCSICENEMMNNKVAHMKKIIKNEDTYVPLGFYSTVTKTEIKEIFNFLFQEIKNEYNLKTFNDMFHLINKKFFTKYNMGQILTHGRTIYDICKLIFNSELKLWQVPTGCMNIWNDKNNIDDALEWFKEQIILNKDITKIEELKTIDLNKLTKKYNLTTLFYTIYKGSRFEFLQALYPNKFKEWEIVLPNNYYESDENKKKVLTWFINKLIEDGIILSIDDIPKKIVFKHFEDYNIRYLITTYFKSNTFSAFNFLYPNRWKPWEFASCEDGFWNNKSNIKDVFQWFFDKLIEDEVINTYNELTSIPINKLLIEYKLSSLFHYCTNDLSDILIELFPNIFTEDYKNTKNIAKDGTKVLSEGEMLIHNYLIDNFKNVKYFKSNAPKEYKFYNPKYDENYIPDWIINDNIIIEFFGMYSETEIGKDSISGRYSRKTKRKIELYNDLNAYIFISLYPKDIRFNLKGVKNKLNKYIIIENVI